MGLKKKQFATRIGVSDTHLSRWINGRVIPRRHARTMIEIATEGQVPADGWCDNDSLGGSEINDAPEHIWAIHFKTKGAVMTGAWADTIRHAMRHFGGGVQYTRSDLCLSNDEADDLAKEAIEAAIIKGMNIAVTVPIEQVPDAIAEAIRDGSLAKEWRRIR
jgi:transcriptional regulator with XRE-family HTH domain